MNKKNQDLVRLGKLIRNAREEANLTQEELASKAEVDRSYIGGIERVREM
jgi:transcriptional regulator with XRE-family HTH domain